MEFILKKSDLSSKKFVMVMPELNHKHHFGAVGYRDRTLINDSKSTHYIKDKQQREKVVKNYQSRHRGDKIHDVHSPGALSWYVLWSADTLSQGIKNYEKKFNVKVKNKT